MNHTFGGPKTKASAAEIGEAAEGRPLKRLLATTRSRFADAFSVAIASPMRTDGEVIAINPPLLTTHTFPSVELDYDIIRPTRVMRRLVGMVAHGA